MITHPAYSVDPWSLHESGLQLDMLAQSESVFALSNGHIGWRGNLDEGEPHGLPGSYLNGVHELRPLPYAEAGYGYPESGQSVINVTNGKIIRLLVDDEPFDLRYGTLRSHERTLDLRSGLLHRVCEWTSPSGHTVRVRSTRLVAFSERAIAAIRFEVEAVDADVRLVVQSELVANEALPQGSGDPRATAAITSPLVAEEDYAAEMRLRLIHTTEGSRLRVAAAADHLVEGPAETQTSSESDADVSRLTVTSQVAPGQSLRLTKFVSYGWSAERSLPSVRDQVDAALAGARSTGWEQLLAQQRSYLDDFWEHADVEVDGDPQIQQAVRFGLFHALQAGARVEGRAIPAKGLTGSGYDGHCFWDTEAFVLPVLTYTHPEAVAGVLRWRQNTLPAARERALQLGLKGATFPWRTVTGSECSAYWPAGTAAFHINADIADAVTTYVAATGDEDFARDTGVEILVETARLWASLGQTDAGGNFHIDGVTGPDEYSALVDDNVFTNLMARSNLSTAVTAVQRYPEQAAALGVSAEEATSWRLAAERTHIPYNDDLDVHEQHAGFTRHEKWDFAETGADQYPLLLHYPYFDLYRKQVVKQADLVLAMYKCGDLFSDRQKRRNFAYYEALTVRDSSLSACCQAIMAAEVGHMDLAYAYLGEAALMDLDDLENNTRDGLHIASLAGSWLALVAGFGGMRQKGATLTFAPRLPGRLSRLAFKVQTRGRCLRVEIDSSAATYTLTAGEPLTIVHEGTQLTVSTTPSRPMPLLAHAPESDPEQPHGRRPAQRP
ncbi:glycoside hydrolase family 65 protein [Streptomyces sp. NPDC005548]|uniref:glycoside hydrolase family 65 protein n=1 Tax=Streptomyces sp. NPDC005548 TaxID=3364724 RepID=UPI0036C0E069